MTILLSDAGKRFNRDWIFRNLNYNFTSGTNYAITGPNGSGKSTLLQSLGGAIALSEGKIHYKQSDKEIADTEFYTDISLAAPYLEVIEEMTLTEFLTFHAKFKPLRQGSNIKTIVDEMQLSHAAEKQIRYYSSGMKQRVKLAQAIFSDTSVLLLDEPCTNLDESGIELYQQLMKKYTQDRLVIVSSNDISEYGFCTVVIKMNTTNAGSQ
ncbi:MAG: ATP-binding cassette domain-containing protein [Gemmatimonadaceae bacterium]|nr:ATP-binding cassette domain-containing protein [Chitinophagaceae bacterium]